MKKIKLVARNFFGQIKSTLELAGLILMIVVILVSGATIFYTAGVLTSDGEVRQSARNAIANIEAATERVKVTVESKYKPITVIKKESDIKLFGYGIDFQKNVD